MKATYLLIFSSIMTDSLFLTTHVNAAEKSTNELGQNTHSSSKLNMSEFDPLKYVLMREKHGETNVDFRKKTHAFGARTIKLWRPSEESFGTSFAEPTTFHLHGFSTLSVPKFRFRETEEESLLDSGGIPSCVQLVHKLPFVASSGDVKTYITTDCQDLSGGSYYFTVRVELFVGTVSVGTTTKTKLSLSGRVVSFKMSETEVNFVCRTGVWATYGLITYGVSADGTGSTPIYNNTLPRNITSCTSEEANPPTP